MEHKLSFQVQRPSWKKNMQFLDHMRLELCFMRLFWQSVTKDLKSNMLFFSASSFRNRGAACVTLSIPEQKQLMNCIAKGY